MSKLSALLGVTPGTLTTVAGGLVKKGYLERQRSSKDDRVVNLSLAEPGREMVARIRKYRRKFFEKIGDRLTLSQQRKLIRCHTYIYETYRQLITSE